MRTVHYENCENAASRTCRCAWCAGTRHGWQGAIGIAKDATDDRYERFRERAEKRWQEEQEKRARYDRRKPTKRHQTAAVDLCRVNLIHLLRKSLRLQGKQGKPNNSDTHERLTAEATESSTKSNSYDSTNARINPRSNDNDNEGNTREFAVSSSDSDDGLSHPDRQAGGSQETGADHSLAHQVEELGNRLFNNADVYDNVLNDIEKDYGRRLPDNTKRAMDDHFWCDLLAHLAYVLSESVKLTGGVSDRIVELVFQSRESEGRTPIDRTVVTLAVKHSLRRIQELQSLGFISTAKSLLPAIRILAIMICKEPERHRAVMEYCVDPLGGKLLANTRNRLVEIFCGWLPEMTARRA